MAEGGHLVVVRLARTEDVEGLVASSIGLFEEDAGTRDLLRNPDWPRLHGAPQYAKNIADPDMLVLAAACNGAVVGHLTGGFAAASPMWSAARAHLISMYVMPPWRGQNVGSALVEHFTAWAKAKGVAQIRVTAYSANEGAARFYRRHGFTELETTLAVDL